MKKSFFLYFLLLCAVTVTAAPLVYVSILPQLESVQAIGKGVCRAEALLQFGQSPETFQFNGRVMESMRHASVFMGIGLPFERAVVSRLRRIYPNLLIIDTSEKMDHYSVDGRRLSGGIAGKDGSGADPHLWLSIENMLTHSRTVEAVLSRRFPESASLIHANAVRYQAHLRTLKSGIGGKLSFCRGRQVLVYHPAFGYFLRENGMVQCAVEKDGKAPGGRYLDRLIRDIRRNRIGTLFHQPQFSGRMAENLSRRLNLRLVELDPLPVNYSEGLQEMADKVASACREK